MKIEQGFYLIEIADTGSLSQAARNLYITQPNLTHAVKQIESETGYPVFIRTPGGMVPTQEGRQLIEHLRIIKREYDHVQQMISYSPQAARLALRVATLDFGRATPVFSELIRRYIGIPVNFSFLNCSTLEDLLPEVETCQVDFAVIGTLSPFTKDTVSRLRDHSIEYHKLADTPICAIVGPENPLFGGPDTQPLSAFYPYTVIQHGNAADEPSRSLPYVTGLSKHCFGEVHVNNSQLFYNTIETTTAVGLIAYAPLAFQAQNTDRNIQVIHLSDCSITAQFGWIKNRRFPLTDTATVLLHEIMKLF